MTETYVTQNTFTTPPATEKPIPIPGVPLAMKKD